MADQGRGSGRVELTILGQPASMKNSRQLIRSPRTGKVMPILSEAARTYVRDLKWQVPVRHPLLAGRLRATITIWYRSERPDLDEAIILDALQGRIYENDRQVREKHVFHRIDRNNPRAHVVIEPLQAELELAETA